MAHQQGSVPIGVGTWAWGNQLLWGYRSEQDAMLQATFARAVQLGLHFFDTADSYGTGRLQGRSETLLGQFRSALPQELSERLVVATKLAPFPWRLGRQGLRRAFDASRRRLGGRLERVQLHWSTARYAPWQEGPLLQCLADRVAEGAVGSLGLSNVGPRRLRQLHQQLSRRGVPVASLQVQLSLLAPEAMAPGGVAEVCRELGITLIAYSPLALGLLARASAEPMPPVSGARRLLFARLQPRIGPLQERLVAIARSRDVPTAAVALNWCRSHGALPIVGLRSVEQVEAAAAAAQWNLEEAERQELDAVAMALDVRMPANPFCSA